MFAKNYGRVSNCPKLRNFTVLINFKNNLRKLSENLSSLNKLLDLLSWKRTRSHLVFQAQALAKKRRLRLDNTADYVAYDKW